MATVYGVSKLGAEKIFENWCERAKTICEISEEKVDWLARVGRRGGLNGEGCIVANPVWRDAVWANFGVEGHLTEAFKRRRLGGLPIRQEVAFGSVTGRRESKRKIVQIVLRHLILSDRPELRLTKRYSKPRLQSPLGLEIDEVLREHLKLPTIRSVFGLLRYYMAIAPGLINLDFCKLPRRPINTRLLPVP